MKRTFDGFLDRLDQFAQGPIFPVLLFLGGVVTRLVGARVGGSRSDDDGTYLAMARNWIAGRGLVLDGGVEGVRVAYQPPGFGVFHILFLEAFGDHFHLAERLFTVLFSAATCVLFFYFAKRFFSRRVAALISLFFVAYPPQWFWSTRLYPHVYALNMTLLCFYLTLIFWEKRSYLLPLVIGLVWATITLMRAEYVLGLFCIALATLVAVRPIKPALIMIGLLFVGMIAGMTPWTVRTHRLLHRWVFVATHGGITMWMVFRPEYKYSGNMFSSPEVDAIVEKLPDESARERFYVEDTKRMIREYPLRSAEHVIGNFLKFWKPWPSSDITPPRELLVYSVSYLPMFFLFLVGLFQIRWLEPRWILVGSFFLSQMLGHLPFVMIVRYREMVFPYMVLIAGAFLQTRFGDKSSLTSAAP